MENRVNPECTGECDIDPHSGQCAGCTRDIDEIAGVALTQNERKRIIDSVCQKKSIGDRGPLVRLTEWLTGRNKACR